MDLNWPQRTSLVPHHPQCSKSKMLPMPNELPTMRGGKRQCPNAFRRKCSERCGIEAGANEHSSRIIETYKTGVECRVPMGGKQKPVVNV